MECLNKKIALILILSVLKITTTFASPVLYVPMGNANNLVIIDLTTDKIIGRINELENAHGLSSSHASEYLVAGSMKPLDVAEQQSMNKPGIVSEEEHAAHHASKGDAGNIKSPSYISIIHPKHGHVIRRIAVRALSHHTAVSPDGKIAVVVHSGAGGISIINLDHMSVSKTIDTGQWPNYAVFSKNGAHLYVSNAGDNTVTEIGSKNWKITRQLTTGKGPEHMVLGAQGNILYVVNKADGTASVIDLVSGHIKQSYKIGNKPHGIDISGNGKLLFVVSKKDNIISRVELSNSTIKTAELSPAPYHLTYINGQHKIYVSSRKLAKIWVINPTTLSIQKTIELDKGIAHQMVLRND